MLQVLLDDGHDGRPLVFHWGTPCAAVWFEALARAANHAGLRLVTYSRPGYDGSTPHPGRRVADVALDVSAILDAVGADTFLSLGWSGGGPSSLACAALLPERCLAAGSIAGVAPYSAEGIDWMAGMGQGNIDEFSAAVAGEGALRSMLAQAGAELKTLQGADLAASLGTLMSDVDKEALTTDFANMVAASFRGSVERGIEGWIEDDLAFVADWGFSLADIKIPVAIWHGAQDRMVPLTHGKWQASQIPGVQAHLVPDEGHLSIPIRFLDEIVGELARLPERSSVG